MENIYHPLIDQISKYKSNSSVDSLEYLKFFDFAESIIYAKAPLIYVMDCVNEKYLCLYSIKEQIFGYNVRKLEERGPRLFTSLLHPADLKIYDEKVYPEIINFLKRHSPLDYHS